MKWSSVDLDTHVELIPSNGMPAVNPLDPYFAWAVLSHWRGMKSLPEFEANNGLMAFVAEIDRSKDDSAWMLEALGVENAGLASNIGRRHGSFRIQRESLKELRALDQLVRWELAVPVVPVKPGVTLGLNFRNSLPLVGVIDDGLAVLHSTFEARASSPLQTRIVALWDQNKAHDSSSPAIWKAPSNIPYGRILDMTGVDRELQRRQSALESGDPVEDETDTYRKWDYLVASSAADSAQRVWFATHGTHVTSVVGGLTDPIEGDGPASDAAAEVPLAFVSLPEATAADPSAGSLAAHVIDGLHFLIDVAGSTRPVVAVLSYGQHAGPHDGTSILECAMDELLAERHGGLAIVLGAGNSRLAASHVRRRVRAGAPGVLRWSVPERDRTDSFCELWYRQTKGAAPAAVTVRITDPNGDTAVAGIDEAAVLADGSDPALAALIHRKKVPNGRDAMVLLALGPTSAGADPAAPAGVWTIEVMVDSGAEIEVRAWIEREDPLDEAEGEPSSFLDDVNEDGTINGIATGKRTLVAGGMRLSDGVAAGYSSLGPTASRAPRPHAWAISDESASQPGIRAAAVRSTESHRMAGTSVAAPALARLIVNAMASKTWPGQGVDWNKVLRQLEAKHPHRLSIQRPRDEES